MTAVLCRHHWLLPSPNGPIIPATCRDCGAVRSFPADLEAQIRPWDKTRQANAVKASRKTAEAKKRAQGLGSRVKPL